MHRRQVLHSAATGLTVTSLVPLGCASMASAASRPRYERTLLLITLKGGNDSLNTLIPHTDRHYRRLRPSLAIDNDRLLRLDATRALHPALSALMPSWQENELAVVDGVGYANASLSHFRSMDIWETASSAQHTLDDGWLGRTFAITPPPSSFTADAVAVSGPPGPLASAQARTLVMRDPQRFKRQSRTIDAPRRSGSNPALNHVLEVKRTIARAAQRLELGPMPTGKFPNTSFGHNLKTAVRLMSAPTPIAAIKVTLDGFDTHARQLGRHARLLEQLAQGLHAARQSLQDAGRWRNSAILTYSEFGRRPKENDSRGTDHGACGVQFLLGEAVRGGLYGTTQSLARLDGNGNLPYVVDFRQVYATVLEHWWKLSSRAILGGRFTTLDLFT